MLQNLFVDSLFAKNLPENVRGVLNGLYFLSASLGMLAFSKIGGICYDLYGTEYPFLMVGIADIIYINILLICYVAGILR
jgi:MFS family permease